MLTTKKQAADKWCPAARIALTPETENHYQTRLDNRAVFDGTMPTCLGSGCMAWRWDRSRPEPVCRIYMPEYPVPLGAPEPPRPADVPASWLWESSPDTVDVAGWYEPAAEVEARRLGYCGLAGPPQPPPPAREPAS